MLGTTTLPDNTDIPAPTSILASPTSPAGDLTSEVLEGVLKELAQLSAHLADSTPHPKFRFLQNLKPPRKRIPASAPSSPPPPKYNRMPVGLKTYMPVPMGWMKVTVQMNQKDNIVQLINENPALKTIFCTANIPGADQIDVLPATPKGPSPTFRGRLVMAHLLFHDIYNSMPFSFYCIRVNPDNVWVFAVFCNLNSLTTTAKFKNTFCARLLADSTVINMVKNDHCNVLGKYEPSTVLDVVLHFAQVSTCTVHRRTASSSIPITVYHLVFPLISNDPAATACLRNHIMSPGFVFEITHRGGGKPVARTQPSAPQADGMH
ncbi:hypothetical protein B0H13DRAFT_1903172 [Mycena leptocephala]|nr:hypothetical protein B0H13DRAFT_1903172 [Mycena leptocephala]